MKHLVEALNRDQIFLDVAATDMTSAIQETVRKMVASGILAEQLRESVIETLLQRERDTPTIIGNAVAIPHAYLEGIEQEIVLFVRLSHPVNMGAPDGIPTQFLFFLLGPPNLAAQHLDTLAYIARLTSDEELDASEDGYDQRDWLAMPVNHSHYHKGYTTNHWLSVFRVVTASG